MGGDGPSGVAASPVGAARAPISPAWLQWSEALLLHGDLGLRDMIFRKESLGGSHEGQRTDRQTTTVVMLKYHPVSERCRDRSRRP